MSDEQIKTNPDIVKRLRDSENYDCEISRYEDMGQLTMFDMECEGMCGL